MNYYHLPGTGIFGGIKVGYQFADLLNQLGARTVMVTPDGHAPAWFRSSAPTLHAAEAGPRFTGRDVHLFSLPHDYERLLPFPGRRVFHCQGTDPLIDPILADPHVELLTCWPQAAAYVRTKSGRPPHEVGLSISACFYHQGRVKQPATVAYMPRRGAELAAACRAARPELRFVPIDGATEAEVARILLDAEFYLATAEKEWFGLPALEAMAAGCVVVSVPTLGGMDYLRSGHNAMVVEGPQLADQLRELARPGAAARRAALRDRALLTASAFRLSTQRRKVAGLLAGPLSFLTT